MRPVEVKVPDIGDFDEVAVIELLVKVGDTVKAEQSLITLGWKTPAEALNEYLESAT